MENESSQNIFGKKFCTYANIKVFIFNNNNLILGVIELSAQSFYHYLTNLTAKCLNTGANLYRKQICRNFEQRNLH